MKLTNVALVSITCLRLNWIILSIGLFIFNNCSGIKSIPEGSGSIEVDGKFNDQLWKRALHVDSSGGALVFMIADNQHVYVGVKITDETARYVDLYLKDDKSLINLHASMQTGERLLPSFWNDTIPAWKWGTFKNWSANKVRVVKKGKDLKFKESLTPYEGFEFIIDKSLLHGTEFLFRVEVRDFMGEQPDIVIPFASERLAFKTWGRVKIKSMR